MTRVRFEAISPWARDFEPVEIEGPPGWPGTRPILEYVTLYRVLHGDPSPEGLAQWPLWPLKATVIEDSKKD